MTEDEAKTKWCPFVRVHGGDLSFNRYAAADNPAFNCTCLGSACMAWRWRWIPEMEISRGAHLIESKTEGYCGLAGKPGGQP